MLIGKKALLLDMNSTFMFGEDRFSETENYSKYYESIGGALSTEELKSIIPLTYNYLGDRYPDEKYRQSFPSLEKAIKSILKIELSDIEIEKIIETFAFHELGHIPKKYVEALHRLNENFTLAVVIDIWSPKKAWLDVFDKEEISSLFKASSFSSDHGMVKPSPKPFELVVKQLNLQINECLVIGDSIRRDLGGSIAAGLDCVLVGNNTDSRAIACYPSLLEFCDEIL